MIHSCRKNCVVVDHFKYSVPNWLQDGAVQLNCVNSKCSASILMNTALTSELESYGGKVMIIVLDNAVNQVAESEEHR